MIGGVDRRSVRGWHVDGVDNVFDADRDAVQRTTRRLRIALLCFCNRAVGIEMGPRADCVLAREDTIETSTHQRLAGQFVFANVTRRVDGAELVWIVFH